LVDNELLGDPLDLKMFQFTSWTYEENERGKKPSQDASEDQGIVSGLSPAVVRPNKLDALTSSGVNNSAENGEVCIPSI
jgi:cation-transporting ATPase 13A3/4/5